MPKTNPILKDIAIWDTSWSYTSTMIVQKIKEYMGKGVTYNVAVTRAMKDLNIGLKLQSTIADLAFTAMTKTGLKIDIPKQIALKEWYLSKSFKGSSLKLSSKINNINMIASIKNAIKTNLDQSNSIQKIARSLTTQGLTKADVPEYINKLTSAAKKIVGGDTSTTAFKEYKSTLAAAGRNISNLKKELVKQGSDITVDTRLAKAYNNLLAKTKEFSSSSLDSAIERAVKAKANYNAQRVARSEAAKAYGIGFHAQNLSDDDSVGYRWILSSGHGTEDICDYNADLDAYGLGPGGYPKDEGPEYPAHPNCMCSLAPIYRGEVKDMDPDVELDPEFKLVQIESEIPDKFLEA